MKLVCLDLVFIEIEHLKQTNTSKKFVATRGMEMVLIVTYVISRRNSKFLVCK